MTENQKQRIRAKMDKKDYICTNTGNPGFNITSDNITSYPIYLTIDLSLATTDQLLEEIKRRICLKNT